MISQENHAVTVPAARSRRQHAANQGPLAAAVLDQQSLAVVPTAARSRRPILAALHAVQNQAMAATHLAAV